MNAALFEDREDPGRKASAALAAAVHVALIVLLVYGIRWQTRSPEAVEVELVRALPAPAPAAVAPPEPEPAPPPKVKPKPEPKIEPKPEPKPAKPDIALKEKERPKPKPEPKPVPKAEPKPKPEPRAIDRRLIDQEFKELEARRIQQMVAREQAQLKADQAAVARSKATADYIGKIKGKIKGNIVLPPDIRGNPEAIFDVVQLPSGEILSVKLKKSSGHAAYDNAIERAILKSSPLPKPEQGDLFSRSLELKFRPLEEE